MSGNVSKNAPPYSDNGYDHRAGTEIYDSIGTRKSGFVCIVLLSRGILTLKTGYFFPLA